MHTVFIVEDNKDLSRMYERAFRLNNFEVEVAFDGAVALERLQTMKGKPSVILLDIIMPNMSGIDVLRAIKQDDTLKHIPVAILTNSLKKENTELFLSLGASAYIIKLENDAKDVVDRIAKLLTKAE